MTLENLMRGLAIVLVAFMLGFATGAVVRSKIGRCDHRATAVYSVTNEVRR
jgi:hypothetical protein